MSVNVLGDIQSIHVPPPRWGEAYVRFVADVNQLIGEVREVGVGRGGALQPFVGFAAQVPGWPQDQSQAPPVYLLLRGTEANVLVLPCAVGFKLLLRQPALDFEAAVQAMPTLVERALAYVEKTMQPECISATIGVRTSRTYPVPLPPSNDPQFRGGMCWWKVDSRCPDVLGKPRISRERFDHAATMPLPPQVERTWTPPFLSFSWTWQGELSPDALALQQGLQHQWLRDALGLSIDSNYNELGDALTGAGARSADPAFTFYEPDLGTRWGAIGTKALVPEQGRLDPAALAELGAMRAAGRTPTGTAVNTVRVVVPSREMAIACIAQARAAGVDAVLYPGELGLMDAFPECEGGWLHEVDAVRGYRGVRRHGVTE